MIPFVGHVQIAQTPKRNCPMSEDGELNHRYFLSKLIQPFYQDFIGLEYIGEEKMYWTRIFQYIIEYDLGVTDESFEWLEEFSSIN